ncbi:hypothetical protein U1Q18_020112 [Sarracenia purpurea var. burkii]
MASKFLGAYNCKVYKSHHNKNSMENTFQRYSLKRFSTIVPIPHYLRGVDENGQSCSTESHSVRELLTILPPFESRLPSRESQRLEDVAFSDLDLCIPKTKDMLTYAVGVAEFGLNETLHEVTKAEEGVTSHPGVARNMQATRNVLLLLFDRYCLWL